jgi:hypothetical protein
MMSRRFGSLSTTGPAKMDRRRIGANCSAPITPSRKAELVSSKTSQDCPTDCIHVPSSETPWPVQKIRKSR